MGLLSSIYNLRDDIARFDDVADAIDDLATGFMSNTVVTATGSVSANDGLIFVNNSSNITLTLPAPSTCQGKTFAFVKVSDNVNTATIAAAAGSIFNKGDNVLRRRGDVRIYVSNGANYFSLDLEHFSAGGNSFTPTYSGHASMTWTNVTTISARWWELGANLRYVSIEALGTVGGTLNNRLTVTVPFNVAGNYQSLQCALTQGSFLKIATAWGGFGALITIEKIDETNFSAGSVVFGMQGIVRI